MINQWGLYAGIDAAETAIAAEPDAFRRMATFVGCVVGMAVLLTIPILLLSLI